MRYRKATSASSMLDRMPHLAILLWLLLPAFTAAQLPEEQQAEEHARRSYGLAQEGRLPESEAEMGEAIRLSPKNPLYRSALAGRSERGRTIFE